MRCYLTMTSLKDLWCNQISILMNTLMITNTLIVIQTPMITHTHITIQTPMITHILMIIPTIILTLTHTLSTIPTTTRINPTTVI